MEKMPGHPRLYRRGATYYHRAAIPVDIKDSYPKAEETFSLRTKDRQEAVRRVRVAAAEVDRRFEAHRRQLAQQSQPPVKELSDEQIKHIGEVYYAYLLEEDEEGRLQGFSETERGTIHVGPGADVNQLIEEFGFRRPTFEAEVEERGWLDGLNAHDYARGKVSEFFLDEVEEVLSWSNVAIHLDRKSPSWKKAARELQSASLLAAEAISGRDRGKPVETPSMPDLQPQSSMPRLSEAVEEWAKEKVRTSWVEKTEKEHRVWMAHFIAVVGDRPLDAYTKVDGRAFKAILLKLPANWVKQTALEGLTVNEAARTADELGLPPMSDNNVNKLLGFVGSFWTWAANNYDDALSSPFQGLKIAALRNAREERDSFSLEELQAIFTAPLYAGCRSVGHWNQPGQVVPRDAGIFWVPLIGLFSGARLGEIAQLYTEDVRVEDGVRFFDINDEGDDKRLKNRNSKRVIPVHPMLVELGLMELVESRRRQGEKRLFPDLRIGNDGYYSSPLSKHFNRFLRSVGAKREKNAFHSFRHSFEDACRDAGMSKEVMDAIQGHGEQGMAARYGRGYTLQRLDEAMSELRYRGLDFSRLEAKRQA